jgi:amino acid transporter
MADQQAPKLVQAVGLFSLIAIAINGIIGAGIFVLPATVAKILGPMSPVAYLIAGLAVVLIVLCFAEVGSMFENAGGPYVYAQAAFGNFIGFEVGWMFLLTRISGMAAVSNAFAAYLGYFIPPVSGGAGRTLAITVIIVTLATLNLLGVRYGVGVVNLLTAGKLAALLLFIFAGLLFVDPSRYQLLVLPPAAPLKQASLVLVFAFLGFEFASVPSEEVINTRRNLPIALVIAIALVAMIYILIQIVALGTLPELASTARPLAAAGQRFLGPAGAAIITLGAILSTSGTQSAQILVGTRMLYALANGGLLPAPLARIHARFRTPYISIVLFTVVVWSFAISSSFGQLAAVAAIAGLFMYITTCLAVIVLRRKSPHAARQFVVPGGPVIPLLAVALSVWLLTGSTRTQATAGGTALLAGAAIFSLQLLWKSRESARMKEQLPKKIPAASSE